MKFLKNMLRNKNVLITGCNRGIGLSIMRLLAEHGANIWACCRTINDAFLEDISELERIYDVSIKAIQVELTDSILLARTLDAIIAEKRSIDILINNAGITATALLQQTSMEEIRKVFDINYFVPLAIIKKISKIMIRQRDSIIINMASVAGIEHQPGRVAYGSSKAALIWATQGLAKELGAFNIRVNAIAPGAVKTEMTAGYSEDKIKKIIAETALHRMGDMIDIANVVLFLCSKEASFINGQVIKVDGGR